MNYPARPSRGEVWKVDLDPTVGHEQGLTRPALVISVDQLNHGPSELVTIVPITSKPRKIPIHIHVKRGQGGLEKDSWILCDQIRTLSVRRFIKPYEAVDDHVMEHVEETIRIVLGL
ncbi:MAG: type II toxin-antitoxin system PemK/MazF family toxin [Phycisphaeraceae bacterium]